MTETSKICQFIQENPTDWQEKLHDKRISTSTDNDGYCVFSYQIDADFSDPIVKEARGIIIDIKTLTVVCWPFSKFGNWSESYADEINWESAKVQEKIDGSIIKIWWDFSNNDWRISTNNVIDATCATIVTLNGKTNFDKLVRNTKNFKDIDFDKLDKNCTYIFELVGPDNRVVIKHDTPYLYHIGTRNNITGEEMALQINIERPKEYDLHSLEQCFAAADALNDSDDVAHEGFVVVDKYFHRIKIKTPEYIAMHHMTSDGTLNKKSVIKLLLRDRFDVKKFCACYPYYTAHAYYYQYKFEEAKYDICRFIVYARNLFEEVNKERKAVALQIKDHKLARYGFAALDSNLAPDEFVNMLDVKDFLKLIDDYKPTTF